MTSTQPEKIKSNEENLKLLQERIAQLESREEDPPRSRDEQAAEDAFQDATTAARTLVANNDMTAEEKLRLLQAMFTNCVTNVRALEYELGLEEKRLSVAELDYSELGEDLRKIEALTDKLKTLSRELSKQNKIMMEESEKRTAEERGKREEIVAKFDEAMNDINARLNTNDNVEEEKDDNVTKLEEDLDRLQAQYDERETFYEKSLNDAIGNERQECELLREAEENCQRDELALVTERRKLVDLKKKSRTILQDLKHFDDTRRKIEDCAKERQETLKRQRTDIKRLQQSEIDLGKVTAKLSAETDELREKVRKAGAGVKAEEEELEFWKAKSKGELEKRETLERLCRTLTEERTIMRKEVQAMQAIWALLEREMEKLRLEISEASGA